MLARQQAFGYTQEDLRFLIGPMAQTGEEPIGSMGTDTPLAVLSDRPRLLFDYFKQLFAQVTNPPLDAIREELVTSMGSTIGPERNLLEPEPESCRQIQLKYPIIHNEHVAKLRHLPPDMPFRSTRCRCSSIRRRTARGWTQAMDELCRQASEAVKAGFDILILSDRGVGRGHGADPEPAGHGRRAPPPGARGHADAGARWSSSAATRARSTTSRCCSATAPASSTRTSPSRRSTT